MRPHIREIVEYLRQLGVTDVTTQKTGKSHIRITGRYKGHPFQLVTGHTPSGSRIRDALRTDVRRRIRQIEAGEDATRWRS